LSSFWLFYYAFNIYTMQRRMVGWLTGNELEKIWNEAIMI
jgi:hypothetical protein